MPAAPTVSAESQSLFWGEAWCHLMKCNTTSSSEGVSSVTARASQCEEKQFAGDVGYLLSSCCANRHTVGDFKSNIHFLQSHQLKMLIRAQTLSSMHAAVGLNPSLCSSGHAFLTAAPPDMASLQDFLLTCITISGASSQESTSWRQRSWVKKLEAFKGAGVWGACRNSDKRG